MNDFKLISLLVAGVVCVTYVCAQALSRDLPSPAPPTFVSEKSPIINGIAQRLSMRGAHDKLPLLLFVHGGLGTPYSAIGHRFQSAWEQHFIVIHWEQPGSGKLYRQAPPARITSENLVRDTIEISWGSYLALQAAHRAPHLYQAYVGVGQTAGILEADLASHEWVLAQAKKKSDHDALSAMQSIGHPPYGEVERAYQIKYGLIAQYGGFLAGKTDMSYMFKAVLSSPDYSLWDAISYVRGMNYYSHHLLSNDKESMWQLTIRDIKQLAIPIYLISGENDQVTPPSLLHSFLENLQAPHQSMSIVKGAAHFPFIDQADKFTQLLIEIAAENSGLKQPHPKQLTELPTQTD